MTSLPASSPLLGLTSDQVAGNSTPESMVKRMDCNQGSCPLSYELAKWARTELPVDSVLAINVHNAFSPSALIPQQILTWPIADSGNLYSREIFETYYEFYDRTQDKYDGSGSNKVQPFYNGQESLEERREFVQALGITHVLVDPLVYEDMKPVLDQWPDTFKLLYDVGGWAVYDVNVPSEPAWASASGGAPGT